MSESDRPLAKASLTLGLGAVIISTSPLIVQLAMGEGLGPSAIGAWRLLIGAVILLPLVGAELPRLHRTVSRWCVLAGVAFFVDVFLWHRSIAWVGPGMATILGNTQVFWAAIFSIVFLKEALPRRFWLAAALGFVGIVTLTTTGDLFEREHLVAGLACGLGTGVAYGAYILVFRRAAPPGGAGVRVMAGVLFWVSLVSGSLLMVAAVAEGEVVMPPSPRAWGTVIALALVIQALGWMVIGSSVSRLPAAIASLILLLQPVLSSIGGVVMGYETFSPLQIAGGALTLAGVYLGQRWTADARGT